MKQILLIIICLASTNLFSQTKGKITYRIEIVKDSIEEPYTNPNNTEYHNEALEMLHEAQPVEGYLVFNDSISIYKVEPKIDIPGWNNSKNGLIITPSGINITWFMGGGNSTYYYDWSRGHSITQNKIMGPTVRVIQKPKEWTITKETKIIGGYMCYLATLDKLNGKKTKAWFTPKIPVIHGPKGFNGLPGLIMEIEDVFNLWKVVKIDFENDEADDIIEPLEGDLMTNEEFIEFCGNPFAEN